MKAIDFYSQEAQLRLIKLEYGSEEDLILQRLFPILDDPTKYDCPVCQSHADADTVDGMIVHLMDEHEWTRDGIADWVQAVEEGRIRGYEPPRPVREILDEIRRMHSSAKIFWSWTD